MSEGLPSDDQGAGVLDAMEDAAENPVVPTDDNMSQLHELVLEQVALEAEVAELGKDLKAKNDLLESISKDKLPSKMSELGFKKFTTDDGFNITVADKVAASITKANADQAHEWLRLKGFGDIIKNEVTAIFPKGKEDAALELMGYLDKVGHTAKRKEAVNAQTLKAFVKEQMEKGVTFPDSISIFPYSQATIKK